MQRLRILVAPALGSRSQSCCSRLMPKRQMCSGGGGEVSQGKEARDSGGFWNDKSTRNALFLLGGAAAGLCMYNSVAADTGAIEETNTKRDHEEATERHKRFMERHERDMELYRRESKLYDRVFKVQTAVDDASWELFKARMKLIHLETKVMILEHKVKELVDLETKVMILEHEVKELAAATKAMAAADKKME